MALKKKARAEEKFEIEVIRAHEFKSGDISFDMKVNGVTIYNCTYMNESAKVKKSFVSFPSRKGSDDKYYSYVWFKISDDDLAEIEKGIEAVL